MPAELREPVDSDYRTASIRSPVMRISEPFPKKRWQVPLTLWTPTLSCLNVVERLIGGMTAPVWVSASDPTWIARVPNE